MILTSFSINSLLIGILNIRRIKYSLVASFLFLSIAADNSTIHAQCINPWNLKYEKLGQSSIAVNPGLFKGYDAQYGFLAHKITKDPYVGLPFIFIPAKESSSKKIIVILNGGPGRSNLDLPLVNDTIVSHFSILLPGYRGVDDFVERISHNSVLDGNVVDATVWDISQMIKHYAPDTIVIFSHSFGSVFAQKIIENVQNKTFYIPIYVSPMQYNDVGHIAFSLQNMIQRCIMQCELNREVFHDFLTLPNLSQHDAMGLVFLLGKYANIMSFCTEKLTLEDLRRRAQNEFQQNELRINHWHRDRCLEEFLRTNDFELEKENRIANLLQEYFKGFLKTNPLNDTYTSFSSEKLIIEAEFDYFHFPTSIIIKSTGHSDVWEKSLQILPYLIQKKIDINF